MSTNGTGDGLVLGGVRSGYQGSEVLHGVSLSVRDAETLAILGKNGMGKTTLLKTIIGLIPLQAGTIRLFGSDLAAQPAYRRARFRISYIPQEKALFSDLTVEENLKLGASSTKVFGEQLTRTTLMFPFIADRLRQRAGTLSGGEQKMLMIARAMISEPRLMLIDEISEGLQPSVRDVVVSALKAERDTRGVTILLIEQNLEFAFALASRYALLKGGMIVGGGSTNADESRAQVLAHLAV